MNMAGLNSSVLLLALLLLIQTPSLVTSTIQIHATREGTSNGFGACKVIRNSTFTKPMILECSIVPSDDAYVDNLFPSKSFGDLPMLSVQDVPSIPTGRTYSFLKFNFSSHLPDGLVASNAEPANASLWMYVRFVNFLYNATVEIHTAASTWDEDNVTWNNRLEIDQVDYASTRVRQNGTWEHWNLTNLSERMGGRGEITLAAISNEKAWTNDAWFDSKEYTYLNGTTTPTLRLKYVEPFVTVQTPFSDLEVKVGDSSVRTNSNGQARIMVPWGNYEITIPDVISLSNGTRAKFVRWNDNSTASTKWMQVGNNITLHAEYGTQHSLSVSSSYGTTNGSGWYFHNTYANITITPTSIPARGSGAWFGERYVFDRWTGACNSDVPNCTLLIDGPKSIQAVWRQDWTLTEITFFVATFLAVLLAFIRRRLLRPKRKRAHLKQKRRTKKQ